MTSDELFNNGFKKGSKVGIGGVEHEVVAVDFKRKMLTIVLTTLENGQEIMGDVTSSNITKVII